MFLYFGKAVPPFTSQPVGACLARLQGAKVCKCMKNRNPYLCGNRGNMPHSLSFFKEGGEWLALLFKGLTTR